jgi:hypothetical protein
MHDIHLCIPVWFIFDPEQEVTLRSVFSHPESLLEFLRSGAIRRFVDQVQLAHIEDLQAEEIVGFQVFAKYSPLAEAYRSLGSWHYR